MSSAIFRGGRVLSGSQAKNSRRAWHKAKLIIRDTFGIDFNYVRDYINKNNFYCAEWKKR